MEANGLHHADGCTLVAGSPHPMYMLCKGTGTGISLTKSVPRAGRTRSAENPGPARRRRISARRAVCRGAPEGNVTRIASATAGHRPKRSESGPRRRCLVVSWVSQVAEASQFQRPQCCFFCSPDDLPLSEVDLSMTSDSWRLRDAISRSLVRWILATPSSRARSLPPSLPCAFPAPRCGLFSARARSVLLVSGTYWRCAGKCSPATPVPSGSFPSGFPTGKPGLWTRIEGDLKASGRVAVVQEVHDAVDQSLGCREIKPLCLLHIHEHSRVERKARTFK